MKRVAVILLSLAFLASCTDAEPDAPVASADAEALMNALESEVWTQEVPFDLRPLANRRSSRAALDDPVGIVEISSLKPAPGSGGGRVSITYIVFETAEDASAALDDFVTDFAEHEASRSIEGSPGICVIDGDNNDECNTADGNVMIRVFSRIKVVGEPVAAQTEELLDLALAHLDAVKEEANL